MAEEANLLGCVLIPVHDRDLLLPNVSIAEIVDYAQPEAADAGPEWLSGYLDWRGLKLPIISYDAANGGPAVPPGSGRGRIAVLNTIGPTHSDRPFLAMVTQGIPSQTRLGEDQIRRLDLEPGPADLMAVDVEGQTAMIPNLEHLEDLARQAPLA